MEEDERGESRGEMEGEEWENEGAGDGRATEEDGERGERRVSAEDG